MTNDIKPFQTECLFWKGACLMSAPFTAGLTIVTDGLMTILPFLGGPFKDQITLAFGVKTRALLTGFVFQD